MDHEDFPPSHDAVYGWLEGGTVTALVIWYAGEGEGWSLWPRADVPLDRWPALPLGDGGAITAAVRGHLAAGRVTDLTPVIAETKGFVFHVPALPAEWGGVFAVKPIPPGLPGDPPVFPCGVYVFHRALRAGVPVPPLDRLLADPGRVDLGPRFPLAA